MPHISCCDEHTAQMTEAVPCCHSRHGKTLTLDGHQTATQYMMRRLGTHTSCVTGSSICYRSTAAITKVAGVFRLQPPCDKMLSGSLTGTPPLCCCSASTAQPLLQPLVILCKPDDTRRGLNCHSVLPVMFAGAFTCVVVSTRNRCCLRMWGKTPACCMWGRIPACAHLPMGLAVEGPAWQMQMSCVQVCNTVCRC